jgi:hypothetical protein
MIAMKLCVISGFFPGRRFNSYVNHSTYCETHGYHYIDGSYPGHHPRPHFRKLEVISRYLDLFDWVFWVDDDVYFTDFSKPLHTLLDSVGDAHFFVCRSPSTKKVFTKFTSGSFFLRCSPESSDFLSAALAVDMDFVKKSFWHEGLGHLTVGDQSAMVYLTETDPRFTDTFTKLADHNLFNNRDFEYASRVDEHFLVHFVGGPKAKLKQKFCKRLGLNKYIVPDEILRTLNVSGDDRWRWKW